MIKRIIQVGCGGNGGFITRDLARILPIEFPEIKYILIDGDKVEEKNLLRQNFIEEDINKFKSDVLALRYTNAFGTNIISISSYLNENLLSKLNLTHEDLIIGCVDNHKTRYMIFEYLYKKFIWVDVSNEKNWGQLFVNTVDQNMFDVDPRNLLAIQNNHPEELSCADHLISGEQSFVINLKAALTTFTTVYHILNEQNKLINLNKINYYSADFTDNNRILVKLNKYYDIDKKLNKEHARKLFKGRNNDGFTQPTKIRIPEEAKFD